MYINIYTFANYYFYYFNTYNAAKYLKKKYDDHRNIKRIIKFFSSTILHEDLFFSYDVIYVMTFGKNKNSHAYTFIYIYTYKY